MTGPGPVTSRIAVFVRALRKQAGFSAQALAERTSGTHTVVNRNTIANLENRRLGYLSVDQADALAIALGISLADLVSGDAALMMARQKADKLRAEADRIEREAGL